MGKVLSQVEHYQASFEDGNFGRDVAERGGWG